MEFLPLFLILLAGVVFSAIFRQFHLPWVLALIVAGIVFGQHGLGFVEVNPTLEFLGQVGLVFLMFMAGLETKLSTFKQFRSGIIVLSLINGAIPLAVGFTIGWAFGFGVLASTLLGIIFVSSSIAVVIPTLESNGLIHNKLGRSIVSATIIEDVTSLILLSILLQIFNPTTSLPLPVLYVLLLVTLVVLRYALPRIRCFFRPKQSGKADIFEQEVRTIFLIMLGTVVSFELLGLHPIIAGFFAGLVLSDSIESELLYERLRTISYGIFIPIFFIIVGLNTDISVFTQFGTEIGLVLTVVIGSILAKALSGWIGGRIIGFSGRESILIGAATIPQLSTTLAVVFTAVELGLLSQSLITAMVILSMATTIVAPMGVRYFAQYHA